jgi:hypothetical protein
MTDTTQPTVATSTCPRCGSHVTIPPEPPVGTWVKDRHGATHYRTENGRWAAAPTGFLAGGIWSAMWEARGPLVKCGPYGCSVSGDETP